MVWLKSGGPKMTVKKQRGYKDWLCSFFDGNDEYRERIIGTDQLTDVDPNIPPEERNPIGYKTSNS